MSEDRACANGKRSSHSYLLLILSCATGGHREALTPCEHDFVTPDGVRLRYKVAGQGRPVVMLLHGGPGSNFNAVWPDLERLGRRATVVMYDQRKRSSRCSRSFFSTKRSPGTVSKEEQRVSN